MHGLPALESVPSHEGDGSPGNEHLSSFHGFVEAALCTLAGQAGGRKGGPLGGEGR